MSNNAPDQGVDPADRREPTLEEESDDAGVPADYRAANAGGEMSETIRSRDPDLDDEPPPGTHS